MTTMTTTTTVVMFGAESCASVTCRHGARCEHGRCVCPRQCPEDPAAGETVCASDGLTYRSECFVRLAACQRAVDLDVVRHGPCDDEISGSGDGQPAQSYCGNTKIIKSTKLNRNLKTGN